MASVLSQAASRVLFLLGHERTDQDTVCRDSSALWEHMLAIVWDFYLHSLLLYGLYYELDVEIGDMASHNDVILMKRFTVFGN